MDEVRVDSLGELTKTDAGRLIVGYSSTRSYDVRKTETPERTEFTFELVELAQPFEKRWRYGDDMVAWFRGLLADGLSAGAWDGDDLVGLAIVQYQRWNNTAIVCELHVDPAYRRRGVGRRLLDCVEMASSAQAVRCIAIETQSPNVDAIAFYRDCGYALDACDLSHYNNDDRERGEVALFMKKALT
jgi:ribosomal protein S18 acetylase RimI-like enzyme